MSAAPRVILAISILLVIAFGSACGTKTRISSQWLSPDYKGGPMHKILVVGIADTPMGRRTWEHHFAEALESNGAHAVASYKLLPNRDRLTKEDLEQTVRTDDFQGVVVTRLLEVKEETTYVPPSSHVVPSYGYGYYGYYGRSYDVVHTPGYTRSTEIVRIESRLWNAADSELAWGIISETFDPKSDDDAIKSVIKKLVQKLADDGLIVE